MTNFKYKNIGGQSMKNKLKKFLVAGAGIILAALTLGGFITFKKVDQPFPDGKPPIDVNTPEVRNIDSSFPD